MAAPAVTVGPVAPQAADEWPHRPSGGDRAWEESWYFDVATASAGLGLFVRLAVVPASGTAWYWAFLARPGQPLVAVRDQDVPLPHGRSLEVRAPGLWADAVCEEPMDHWTLGLEAFAVALDDPTEAYGSERGDRIAFGLDLEWEATAPPDPRQVQGGGGYEQACTVHGEVLVGSERVAVDARGHRYHEWGERHWATAPRSWCGGHLDDGTRFAVTGADLSVRPPGLLGDFSVAAAGLVLRGTPVAHAPVRIDGPQAGAPASRLARGLCRFEADDGRLGSGWAERVVPPA